MITTAAQLFIGITIIALQVAILWAVVEAGYWLFCKATGRRY